MAEQRVAVMGGVLWQLRCPSIVFYRCELRESGARKMAGGDEGFSLVLEVWVVLGRESGGGVVYARVGTTEMKKRRLGLWLSPLHEPRVAKLDRFDGQNYTRWTDKVRFMLNVLKLAYVLDPKLNLIHANPIHEEGKTVHPMIISDLEKQRALHRKIRNCVWVISRAHCLIDSLIFTRRSNI
ncbi:unnamed protein product [Lactuca saligna]|uniref:Uncharacterized protein n=1 Tax=Lactuca saligna TaxID=75948 RepID=A0AA35VFR5_LACSI|nr:unnamed protein product [Lactuca saligna]